MEYDRPLCFVIMGFGKKKDPYSNNVINLDDIYRKIIKPTVIKNDLICIRADEITESGMIDKSMYALLYKADVVIADITTYNPNAIYELGVRHAMKPHTTIIISSNKTHKIFDLDHLRTLHYSQYGNEITQEEINEGSRNLQNLLDEIKINPQVDSPFYTFFPKCVSPSIDKAELDFIITSLKNKEDSIYALTEKAQQKEREGKFQEAAQIWEQLSLNNKNEDYYIQRQAFCTYMRNKPYLLIDLVEAASLLSNLKEQNNAETLGLQGAIYKRMFDIDNNLFTLDKAIYFYGKGWNLLRHYYPGENYANCIDLKYKMVEDADIRSWCKIESMKTRREVIDIIKKAIEEGDNEDIMWKYATLSNCYFALSKEQEATDYESLFLNQKPSQAQIDTFNLTKSRLLKY